MGCFGCLCKSCANNVDPGLRYWDPEEVQPDKICFNCHECMNDSWGKRYKLDDCCPRYIETRKHTEQQTLSKRAAFRVTIYNKEENIK